VRVTDVLRGNEFVGVRMRVRSIAPDRPDHFIALEE